MTPPTDRPRAAGASDHEESPTMSDATLVPAIGSPIEFVGPDGLLYRGRIVFNNAGTALASVDGYPQLFPLTPITQAQHARLWTRPSSEAPNA